MVIGIVITAAGPSSAGEGKTCIDCDYHPSPSPTTSTTTPSSTDSSDDGDSGGGDTDDYSSTTNFWRHDDNESWNPPRRTRTIHTWPTQRQPYINLAIGGYPPLIRNSWTPDRERDDATSAPTRLVGQPLGASSGLPYTSTPCCAVRLENTSRGLRVVGRALAEQQVDDRARRNQAWITDRMSMLVDLAGTLHDPDANIDGDREVAEFFGARSVADFWAIMNRPSGSTGGSARPPIEDSGQGD